MRDGDFYKFVKKLFYDFSDAVFCEPLFGAVYYVALQDYPALFDVRTAAEAFSHLFCEVFEVGAAVARNDDERDCFSAAAGALTLQRDAAYFRVFYICVCILRCIFAGGVVAFAALCRLFWLVPKESAERYAHAAVAADLKTAA